MDRVEWLRQYIFGERLRLRSPLTEEECQRRIEEVSRSVSFLIPDVTGEPAATWKPILGKKRLYAWYPSTRRSPWLRATFWGDGAHTIIEGRSGADFLTLTSACALEAVVLYAAWGLAPLPFALLALMPVVYFVTWRNSPHGEQLIDFVQNLLEADDLLTRPGDPIRR